MSDSVEITGMEELIKVLETIPGTMEQALTVACGRIGMMVAEEAQGIVNKRTERLSMSFTSSDPIVEDGTVSVAVGTNVEYAPYVEFGTGWRGQQDPYNAQYPVEGLSFTSKEHWGRWQDDKGEWHVGGPMPAQAPLRRALDNQSVYVEDIVRQAVEERL